MYANQGDYGILHGEGTLSPVRSIAAGRETIFRPAEPPSDHLLACLAFLRRVATVQITGGDKKTFQICVQLTAAVGDPESTAVAFTITRSVDDVFRLEVEVRGASGHHPKLAPVYNLKPCALCENVQRMEALPVKTKHRMLHSAEGLRKILEAGLMGFVQNSLVPPTNEKFYCEGFQRIPAAVVSFLLRGVDQTKL